jgi:hypothetical protein
MKNSALKQLNENGLWSEYLWHRSVFPVSKTQMLSPWLGILLL